MIWDNDYNTQTVQFKKIIFSRMKRLLRINQVQAL